MTKNDHIRFWLQAADNAWKSVEVLHQGKQYVHVLFFIHLTIEKLLKPLWVQGNIENTPSGSHDLMYLLDAIELDVSTDFYELLILINAWNIEVRYEDYKGRIYKIATPDYIADKLEEIEHLKAWLQSSVQQDK